MAIIEIDYMEYASNLLIQEAYIGLNKVGGTDVPGTNQGSNNYVIYSRFMATGDATVKSIRVYTLVSTNVRVALYAYDYGSRVLLTQSMSTPVVAEGWNEISIPDTLILGGNNYYLAVQSENFGGYSFTNDISTGIFDYYYQPYGEFPEIGTITNFADNFLIAIQAIGTPVLLDNIVPLMTSNTAPSGEVSASSESSGYEAYHVFDKTLIDNSSWKSIGFVPAWIKYDFFTNKRVDYYTITLRELQELYEPFTWELQGSNNDSDWTTLDSQSNISWIIPLQKKFFAVSASGYYRYYRLYITDSSKKEIAIGELELFFNTNIYLESTIKTQGNSSLKIDNSYSHIFTKQLITPLNLSEKNTIKFDIRANILGTNLTIKLYNGLDLVVEMTPTISEINIFSQKIFDISSISNELKSSIDRFEIEVSNDENIISYIDNFYADDLLINLLDAFGWTGDSISNIFEIIV